MKNEVAPYAATPDPSFGRRPAAARAKKGATVAEDDKSEPDSADLRLLIEEDAATGTIVYRTVDRRTGRVVQELQRDALLKLGADDDYAAGGIIRAKA